MMTDNDFQNMSVGFQAAEAPVRYTPQLQATPTLVTPAQTTPTLVAPAQVTPIQAAPIQAAQAQVTPIQTASAREPEKKEEQLYSPAPSDLQEKFDRLNVRYKHIVEERDSLSRQIQDLRRRIENEPSYRHDTVEEIRLLNKLMDDERALRDIATEKGRLPIGYDAFARHDKFVNAFLSIVSRGES